MVFNVHKRHRYFRLSHRLTMNKTLLHHNCTEHSLQKNHTNIYMTFHDLFRRTLVYAEVNNTHLYYCSAHLTTVLLYKKKLITLKTIHERHCNSIRQYYHNSIPTFTPTFSQCFIAQLQNVHSNDFNQRRLTPIFFFRAWYA